MNKKTNNLSNIPVTPDVVISATDNLYLAIAEKSENLMHFVYMLVSRRNKDKNEYSGIAETEVASFKDEQRAKMYAETVRNVAAYQQKAMPQIFEMLRAFNAATVKMFTENTK